MEHFPTGSIFSTKLKNVVFSPRYSSAFSSRSCSIIHSNPPKKAYTYILNPAESFLNINRLRAVTKRREVMIQDLLFADDTGLVAHIEQKLQRLMDRLSDPAQNFD